MEIMPTAMPRPAAATQARTDEGALRMAAQEFEAAFLAEMLKHGGVNAIPQSFGGGAGEEAFSDLLTGEYARLLAERGGIGLAERIFEALKARNSG